MKVKTTERNYLSESRRKPESSRIDLKREERKTEQQSSFGHSGLKRKRCRGQVKLVKLLANSQ